MEINYTLRIFHEQAYLVLFDEKHVYDIQLKQI